jgi:hypothetical protein
LQQCLKKYDSHIIPIFTHNGQRAPAGTLIGPGKSRAGRPIGCIPGREGSPSTSGASSWRLASEKSRDLCACCPPRARKN